MNPTDDQKNEQKKKELTAVLEIANQATIDKVEILSKTIWYKKFRHRISELLVMTAIPSTMLFATVMGFESGHHELEHSEAPQEEHAQVITDHATAISGAPPPDTNPQISTEQFTKS
jgi:hypothetical protein